MSSRLWRTPAKRSFGCLYPDRRLNLSIPDKTRTIAQEDLWRAPDIAAEASVRAKFDELALRLGPLPICVAKTQYSFSDDPSLLGAPSGHVPRIRDVRLRAGAGFVVVLMGDIQTMPGLPRTPPPRGFTWSTARSTASPKPPASDRALNAVLAHPRAGASPLLAHARAQPAPCAHHRSVPSALRSRAARPV